jgi:CelD/BcsL family acetyltransferase involved in cellulose biosynthesis
MNHVELIDPHADARWSAFADAHPDALIFHHPLWMKVLERAYGYRQASLACFAGDEITGILPLLEIRSRLTGCRAVSLPFSDYSALLVRTPAAGESIVARAAELRALRRWKYVEIRGASPRGAVSAEYALHRVRLQPDPQLLFKTFEKKRTQYTLKKFEKTGVLVERRTDAEAMAAFMRLNYRTRQKHGIPPQPDRFFNLFHEHLIAGGLGFISIATIEGKAIAASVFLHYKDMIYHKFNASDETYLHLSANPGILWDAIRWGCEQGYRVVDLGRSDLDGEGLIKYKRGWGAEESALQYHRMPDEAAVTRGNSTGMLKPLMQHMPVPLLKVIGKVLYGHAG